MILRSYFIRTDKQQSYHRLKFCPVKYPSSQERIIILLFINALKEKQISELYPKMTGYWATLQIAFHFISCFKESRMMLKYHFNCLYILISSSPGDNSILFDPPPPSKMYSRVISSNMTLALIILHTLKHII